MELTMTNNEKMNQQINEIAELFKGMFTPEEIKDMEEKYNQIIAEGDKCGLDYDEVITKPKGDVKEVDKNNN